MKRVKKTSMKMKPKMTMGESNHMSADEMMRMMGMKKPSKKMKGGRGRR